MPTDDVPRKEVAEALSRLLADIHVLYFKTHGYHWNVVGPMFPALHEMFERQYLELQGAVDPIAERIRALGHPAPGSLSDVMRLARVPEEARALDAMDMIRDLADGHRMAGQTALEALQAAERAGDAVSVDLVTSRLRVHEHELWMLRATAA